MRHACFGIACLLAVVAMTGCTPFFYGGVVVFGPAEDSAEGDRG